jgi:hypothetical protein
MCDLARETAGLIVAKDFSIGVGAEDWDER